MTVSAFLTAFAEAVADDGGLIFLLLLIVFTGVRRVWIFSRELDRADQQLMDERLQHIEEVRQIQMERDQWRSACLFTLGHPSFKGERPPDMPADD